MLLLFATALAQSVGSFVSPGPLAQPHRELDAITQCFACHSPLKGVDPGLCMGCHERVKQQVETKTGFHATKGSSCEVCHADHRGRDFELVRITKGEFDHSETGFELTGRHAKLECDDCHTGDDWSRVDSTCRSCHKDVHGAQLSDRPLLPACEACHTTGGWRVERIDPKVFDHTNKRFVDYVLEGAHVDVTCHDCHFDFVFLPKKHDACVDCHDDPHRTKFGQRCESCHATPASWSVPRFDHDRTGYTLEGVHADVACSGCHGGNVTTPVRHDTCEDCHRDIHRGQFAPRGCADCHDVTTVRFALRDFDHTKADFPLRGKHLEKQCEDCHGDGELATYLPLAHQDCSACHSDAHEGRFAPSPCKICHAETGWAVADFDHARTR
ncbi:MAG: hypothetical protein KC656_18665, partial [Myxococcales bacterium]|nr:hypothetical protein [Myxococcales bacterium]